MKLYAGLDRVYKSLEGLCKIEMCIDKENALKKGDYIYQFEVSEDDMFNATNRPEVYKFLTLLEKELSVTLDMTRYAESILKGEITIYELPLIITYEKEFSDDIKAKIFEAIFSLIPQPIIRYNNPMYTGNAESYACYKLKDGLKIINVEKK